LTFNKLHGLISQKSELFTPAVVITSNPIRTSQFLLLAKYF
jgi:hypothetical protein